MARAKSPGTEAKAQEPVLQLSASQMATFTGCENRWLLGRAAPRDDIEEPEYFKLGKLLHRCFQAWHGARAWRDVFDAWVRERYDPGFEYPKYVQKAESIMVAWELLHGPRAAEPLMSVELPFDLAIPGARGARVRGFLDGVEVIPDPSGIPTRDRYRIHEYKTMGRWGREDRVQWATDTWLYLWAARQVLPNVEGLEFLAVSTYDYKPTDDPEADARKRFKVIEVEWDERRAAQMLDNLRRVARRAQEIRRRPDLAIRNVGDDCKRCEHHQRCLRPWEVS